MIIALTCFFNIVIEMPKNNIQQVAMHEYQQVNRSLENDKDEMLLTVNNSSEDIKHLLGYLLNKISFSVYLSNCNVIHLLFSRNFHSISNQLSNDASSFTVE